MNHLIIYSLFVLYACVAVYAIAKFASLTKACREQTKAITKAEKMYQRFSENLERMEKEM